MRALGRLAATLALGCVCVPGLHAQESLLGKYSGTYLDKPVGVTLEITSVAEGRVKATAYRGARAKRWTPGMACAGNYEMEGALKENRLRLKSVTGPRVDCKFGARLVVNGGNLTGTYGKYKVRLRKTERQFP